jgi:hypothetical protein
MQCPGDIYGIQLQSPRKRVRRFLSLLVWNARSARSLASRGFLTNPQRSLLGQRPRGILQTGHIRRLAGQRSAVNASASSPGVGPEGPQVPASRRGVPACKVCLDRGVDACKQEKLNWQSHTAEHTWACRFRTFMSIL